MGGFWRWPADGSEKRAFSVTVYPSMPASFTTTGWRGHHRCACNAMHVLAAAWAGAFVAARVAENLPFPRLAVEPRPPLEEPA